MSECCNAEQKHPFDGEYGVLHFRQEGDYRDLGREWILVEEPKGFKTREEAEKYRDQMFNLKRANWKKYENHTWSIWARNHTCSICGDDFQYNYSKSYTLDIMKDKHCCFTCAFFIERIEKQIEAPQVYILSADYECHYLGNILTPGEKGPSERDKGFLGYGGRTFYIKHDLYELPVKTNNMWHQGTIPEHFRDEAKPLINAKFITKQEYEEAHGLVPA